MSAMSRASIGSPIAALPIIRMAGPAIFAAIIIAAPAAAPTPKVPAVIRTPNTVAPTCAIIAAASIQNFGSFILSINSFPNKFVKFPSASLANFSNAALASAPILSNASLVLLPTSSNAPFTSSPNFLNAALTPFLFGSNNIANPGLFSKTSLTPASISANVASQSTRP